MAQKGLGTKVSMAIETTAGTEEATRTGTMRAASSSLAAKPRPERVPHLTPSGSTANAMEMFNAGIDVGGDIEGPACYQGGCLGMLLELAMGAVATGSPTGGIYPHAFTLAGALPTATMCVERGSGGLGDEEFLGCKVSTLELSVSAGQSAVIKASVLGMGHVARADDTPPALTTAYNIIHSDCGSVSFNSASYKASSLSLKIDNALAALPELGSLYSAEPERSDFQTIELTCEFVARSDALYAAFIAQTQANVTVTFTDGVRSLAITVHTAKITSYEDPISDPGVIKQKVTWRGLGNGTNHGLAITLSNSNSSSRSP